MPSMPTWAFAAMVAGGLWLCLWTTRLRLVGVVPILAGAIGAASAPSPDLLVTGDGRHLAVVDDGKPLILRDRAGGYVRALLAEASGFDGDPDLLDGQSVSDCSHDACVALFAKEAPNGGCWRRGQRPASIGNRITDACATADIVVSDRRLPRGCQPRWLKLDAGCLGRTGGSQSIWVAAVGGHVADRVGAHPWAETAQ